MNILRLTVQYIDGTHSTVDLHEALAVDAVSDWRRGSAFVYLLPTDGRSVWIRSSEIRSMALSSNKKRDDL